ncbi:MAG: hypothetical protein MRY79_02530 [Alphaproteobacteria bacterium]|nr:hypothetical protein [Alphaproteobacteria bacterium]
MKKGDAVKAFVICAAVTAAVTAVVATGVVGAGATTAVVGVGGATVVATTAVAVAVVVAGANAVGTMEHYDSPASALAGTLTGVVGGVVLAFNMFAADHKDLPASKAPEAKKVEYRLKPSAS